MKKRIGVFGGSFDPVHNGHIHIVKSFLKSGVIDEILITLTPSPPHKDHLTQAPYHHRLRMLELAFAGFDQVRISDLEKSLPAPSYSLQTMQSLKASNPACLFFLCMGEDSLESFHTWHRYKELLAEVTLLVAARPGSNGGLVAEEILEKTIFVSNSEIDISSTTVRSRTAEKHVLPEPVAEYIRKNNLYT
ncbi:MAG: nicotinate (nicotinamide) nucleotide adenylyltransferase [Balneolaceae bacterium]|nr:MAG: nicotinate (nicotinamide) nucleotide adenylyltransferase [Balneolaceae bacterium]